ncbi:noncompact myelin-associated protein isoform X1 [Osmerus eperlanus]|uniref:noncompact myelin-associated protein isoform X1 n=2 Tax=Osmerus eperlanus TaxID=29151 RepID=UPI002E139244
MSQAHTCSECRCRALHVNPCNHIFDVYMVLLKMQTSTVLPTVTNHTTVFSNVTFTTKSQEQILTQSSGAMIAVIVIGIIIILAILLFILKTYNRRTHAARVMGGSSKPRQKKMSSSTVQTSMANGNLRVGSAMRDIALANRATENAFRIPRVDLYSMDTHNMENQGSTDSVNNSEQVSTISSSTVITIHDIPSLGNT